MGLGGQCQMETHVLLLGFSGVMVTFPDPGISLKIHEMLPFHPSVGLGDRGQGDYLRDEEAQGQRRAVTPEAHTARHFARLSLHSPRGPLDRGPVWACPLPPGVTSLGAAEQGLGFLRAGDGVSPATTRDLAFWAGGGSLPVQGESGKSPQPGSQCQ